MYGYYYQSVSISRFNSIFKSAKEQKFIERKRPENIGARTKQLVFEMRVIV